MIEEEVIIICLTEKDLMIDLLYKGELIGHIQSISIEKKCVAAYRINLYRRRAYDHLNVEALLIEDLPFTIIVRTPEKFICAIKNTIIARQIYHSYWSEDYVMLDAIIFRYDELEYNSRKICKRYLKKATP